MEIVVNLFLVRSRDCWIGIGLAWSLSMRDWLLIGRLLWIGCVTCVQFILRRDTSVSPYSRLVPWLLGQLSPSDWHTIDTGLKLDWQIGCRPESSWLRIVLVPLTKWGFVTRIGSTIANRMSMGMIWVSSVCTVGWIIGDWPWIGERLVDRSAIVLVDWWWVGLALNCVICHGSADDVWIGNGLADGHGLDISDGLANWWWVCRFVLDSWIGRLVMDWQIGTELTLDWHWTVLIVNGLFPEWCEVGSLGLIWLDWNRIGTELKSDWQLIGIRLAVDWYGSV